MYTQEEYKHLKVKFPNAKRIKKSYSQAYQEMFVLSVLNGKICGTFVEVGAYHSQKHSNTWNLDRLYDWSGLSIDIKEQCVQDWKEKRRNKFLLADATTLDYAQAFQDAGLPQEIDYLQLDIEPSHNTLAALLKIPFDTYKFSVITFEHDFYNPKDPNASRVRQESRAYLSGLGYVRVAGDIRTENDNAFEDWYVSPEILQSTHFQNHFTVQPDFNRKGKYYIL